MVINWVNHGVQLCQFLLRVNIIFFQVCASVLSFLSLFNELTCIYERNGVYMRRLDRSSKQKENY